MLKRRWFRRPTTIAAVSLVGLSAPPVTWYGLHRTLDPPRAPGSWTLVHDRPATGKYEDFAFPSAKHGWLVSARGVILHTADGGVTWNEQATGLVGLRSIDFLDDKVGFAGTLNGKLFATTNGGGTWTNVANTLPRPALGFCGITHVGKRVHIVGKYTGGAADYFYSPDAGKTWQARDLRPLAQGLVDVAFLNDSIGFIGGMGPSKAAGQPGAAVILKTNDGGRNWRPVFQHNGGRGFAWKLFPISATLIYASLQSQDGVYRIAKSADGGNHWNVLTVATGRPQRPGLQGIGFLNRDTGWVGGFFRGMYTTTDGGRTWTEVSMTDGTINRFEKVGGTLFTAGTRGILRFEARGAGR